MKFLQTTLLFLILCRLFLSEMCLSDEGCITVIKKLTWVPLINSIGKEDSSSESFDYKVLKIFPNCLAIYNSQDNSNSLDTSQTINPIDLARRIPFNKIDMDCGIDGNKICMAYQFIELFDKISYKALALDAITKLSGEFNKQCMILPIIDDSRRDLSENLIYICEENKNNLREFFKFRDKLSRLIDAYQLIKMNDFNFPANSITLKEDLLKTADSNRNMSSLLVKLDSRKIQGFLDPQNLNSKVLDIPLHTMNLSMGINSVLNGIRKGYISTNWSQNFIPKPIDACCFMIALRNFENFTYFCIHYDNPNDFSSYECEKKIDIWLAKINNTAKRNQLGSNGYLIKHQYKSKTFPQLDCRKILEMDVFRDRIHNIGIFQDKACDSLQAFTTNFEYNDCISDKSDDINNEITNLKRYDGRIEDSLDQCLSKGFLDFGKVPLKQSGSRSFLSINENNFPGWKRRKPDY